MQQFATQMRWLAAAAVVAIVTSACGSAARTSTASPSGNRKANAASVSFKGTVKVGVVGDITGDLSVASEMQGALAYFDSVNASGGVDGYKIVPTEYDTESAPSNAVEAFRRAIAAKPAAILGGSFVASSGLPSLAQSGIPGVGDGFAAGWAGHNSLFPIAGDEATHLSDVLLVVDKKYGHAKRIALLGGSIDAADEQIIIKQAPSAGVDLVMKDLGMSLVPTSAQFLTAAEQIKSSGAQGVVGLGVEDLSALQIDLNQLGVKVAVVAVDLGAATKSEDGLLYSDPWASAYVTHDPGINAYLAAMRKYGYSGLIYTTVYGPVRWSEAAMVVAGLKAAGPPFSHAAVVKALNHLKKFTADGVIPAASYPAFHKLGDNCQVVMKVINGKWVSLTNGINPFVCGGPSTPAA